ncbi:MAG: LPS export ABC transporter periplasmic protein LptC [Chitinophagaceae bacterium]|nr:LPS export ABC transporter periplasmic protein LptC [Chitinophagaceae bacterium]MCW5905034.1 LPS export ABC transporter periplasmic protein LptC [Chitinophagaceae bacterium]
MTKHYQHIIKYLAAFGVGCLFIIGCENKMEVLQNMDKTTLGVEEAKNIESYISQSGRMKAKLTAPLMLRYLLDTPKIEFTKTLHVDFYDDTLAIETQLDAKYAQYLEYDSKVLLRDSVVVFNRTGDTLWTPELYWDQNKQEFYTDKPVKVKREFSQKYIHSIGIRSDQNLRDITFYKIQPDSYIVITDSIH